MDKILKDFNFIIDIKVDWGDMDALQHVNNIEYFKYFQTLELHTLKIQTLVTCLESQEFQRYWAPPSVSLSIHCFIQIIFQ